MICPECAIEMKKLYNVREIEEQFKAEGIMKISALKAQYNLLRKMYCPECGFSKDLSPLEIMSEFAAMRKDQGYTKAMILNEVKLKSEEAKKDLEGGV